MLTVQFGSKHTRITRRYNSIEVGDFALHIRVRWRLAKLDEMVVGAADHMVSEEKDNSADIKKLL